MEYDKKITEIKQNLDKAKSLKFRAEARMEQLTKQKEEILKELDELGVKPEELDDEIIRLKNEIEELIKTANNMLPMDLINKAE